MTIAIHKYINARQIKAARALLDWSQESLAELTDLSVATIRKIESGHISPRHTTMGVIKSVFEAHKIEFIPSSGLRLKENDSTMLEGEDCYMQLLDDICHTMKDRDGEVLFFYADSSLASPDERDALDRARKMRCTWRFLCMEDNYYLPYPLDEYRMLPKKYFKRNFQAVYGNKVALAAEVDHSTNTTKKVIVIESKALAEAHTNIFNFMWESCKKPTYTTAPVTAA